MQRTMQAAVVQNFGQPLSIEEVPVPVPLERQPLGAINDVFQRMSQGAINGRIVLSMGD